MQIHPEAKSSMNVETPPGVEMALARRSLRERLITDVDFEAFCTDCFRSIQRVHFAGGMERLQKETILLQLVAPTEILVSLEHWLVTLTHAAFTDADRTDSALQQSLSRQLQALYDKKEQFLLASHDTSALDAEILRVRREQRQGPQLQAGEVLADRFVLDRIVGQGGFATVWRAYDRRGRHMVAVKVLHGQWSSDASRIERFYRGARRMAELQHSAVVQVVAAAQKDAGFHFFAMEYLCSGDLRRRLLQGDLSQQQALSALSQVAEALQFAHQRRIIHRDVKPSNILLDEELNGRLSDFDLVYVPDSTGGTRTSPMGSIFYAAPEAMENAKLVDSPSADIYSLGMTLAFIVYGMDLPQRAWTERKRFWAQLRCSKALRTVIERATAIEPSRRYVSALEFAAALETAIGVSSLPSPIVSLRVARRILWPKVSAQRHRSAFIGLGLLGTLVAVGTISSQCQNQDGGPKEQPARVRELAHTARILLEPEKLGPALDPASNVGTAVNEPVHETARILPTPKTAINNVSGTTQAESTKKPLHRGDQSHVQIPIVDIQ